MDKNNQGISIKEQLSNKLTSLPLTLDMLKLRSDPDTEDVSDASSSESKRGRRVVKAPAPPRVNISKKEEVGWERRN